MNHLFLVSSSSHQRAGFLSLWYRAQRVRKHQAENGSGAEDNGDSSHCSNASTHSNQEAGPSQKRAKTSDDSGPDLDTTNENGTGDPDPVTDGTNEIELVFRPHPTLMEKDEAAQTRYANARDYCYPANWIDSEC